MKTQAIHTARLHIIARHVIGFLIALLIAGSGCTRRAAEPTTTAPEPRPAQVEAEEVQGDEIPAEYALLANPFAADPKSRASGKALYDHYCLGCHGPGGKGDGPKAATLAHKPPDFSDAEMVKEITDAHAFWRISEGVPDEDMPAWKDELSQEQRWHLVSYLRVFSAPPAERRATPEPREAREALERERGQEPREGGRRRGGGPGQGRRQRARQGQ